MNCLSDRTQRWLIPLAILLLALSLRLSTLSTKSMWVDEVNSLQQSSWTTAVILSNPYHDPHPPGYYLFLHEWISSGQSEFWVRLPSAILGGLSVLILYWLGLALQSPRLGRWASFLLAIDPVAIWYAQETRMYAMLTFFALGGTLLMILMLKRRSILAWPLTVLTFCVALYFDYNGLIYWAVSIVIFIVVVTWLKAWTLSRLALWLTAEVAIALLYLPQWPKAFATVAELTQGHIFKLIAQGLQRFGLSIDQDSVPILLIAIGTVFGAGVLFFAFRFMRHRMTEGHSSDRSQQLSSIAIFMAYAGWLILAAAPRFYTIKRVLMIYSPIVALTAAYALILIRRRSIMNMVVGATAIVAILNWIVWPKEDWRGAANLVARQAQPGDVIVGTPNWVTGAFDYYYSNLNGAAQIVSDGQVKQESYQHVWLLIGNTYEQSNNSTIRQDLTKIRKTIGHWQLYEVEVLLLQ